MKKDKDIEILFAEQTADEQPKPELLAPALNELRAQNARKKARKNRLFKFGLGFAAAAVVLVVSLSVLLPRFLPSDKGETFAPAYYTAAEITKTVGISDAAKNALPQITHINGDPAITESAEEYVFSDGSAAYASVSFRRRGRYGIEDVTLTAEFADGVFEEMKDFYALLTNGFGYVLSREDGEYISRSAVKKDGVKFYIFVMSANSIDTEYYAKLFE